MQKKQVAVLDIGSSKITAVTGERGRNKTFVIKSNAAFEYDGFAEGSFLGLDSLKKVLFSAAESIRKSFHGDVPVLYVGVPAAFTQVVVKNSQISFPKKKKITDEDVEMLYEASFVLSSTKWTLINRSPIIFELDDSRRVMSVIGTESEILKGVMSFVLCDNYFIEAVGPILKSAGIQNVEYVSTSLAQAMSLIDAENRDRVAVILDVGYITTTFSVIRGDGLIYEKSFDFGGGYITASISEKYQISFSEAEKLKRKVNLSRQTSRGSMDVLCVDDGAYYSIDELIETIKYSLDHLCGLINEITESPNVKIPDYVPLCVTGGGISYIRGAKEHVSNRLGMVVEIIAPNVPLLDEPIRSASLSLLDLALEQ